MCEQRMTWIVGREQRGSEIVRQRGSEAHIERRETREEIGQSSTHLGPECFTLTQGRDVKDRTGISTRINALRAELDPIQAFHVGIRAG